MKITLNEQECEGTYDFCKAGTYAATVGFASTFGDDVTKVFTDAVNLVHEKYGDKADYLQTFVCELGKAKEEKVRFWLKQFEGDSTAAGRILECGGAGMIAEYREKVMLTKKNAMYINELLNTPGSRIYTKYGLRIGDTIEHTVVFPDGVQAVIRLVIGTEEDYPYAEGVLLDADDNELSRTEPENKYVCLWMLEADDATYFVDIAYPEIVMKEKAVEMAKDFVSKHSCDDMENLEAYKVGNGMLLVIQYVWDEGEPAHEVKLYNADNELVDAYIRSDLNSAEKIADTIMEIWSDYIYKGNKEEN